MNALIIIILVIFASVIIMNVISPSAEVEPYVEPVVVKPKRKYKKRISKKNTIVTAVTKKPVGRPKKTVE